MKWASSDFTYSFPTSASFYTGLGGGAYGTGEQNAGFKAFNAVQQAATTSILNMYAQVANVTFTLITETASQSATLRYAGSSQPSTAWGYYPSSSPEGGDAWFNSTGSWYTNPVVGNYGYLTIIHETGHLLGLKHPHESSGSFGAVPVSADSLEYTVMSYRSYIGASTTQGLTNATWSFPQTLMVYDIASLQYMYGANYNTNNTDTVYKWNPATGQETINGVAQAAPGGNTILSTVWDGGGTDTYDFSNYTTGVSVSLQPGGWTTTSAAQLANLGAGHTAIGNIANAYLYNNNSASLIENAVGGTGSDVITGNTANNKLTGGAGNDTLDGVSGTDTAVYSGPSSAYQVTQNADGSWKVVDLRAGSPDGTDTLKNIDFLQFSDTTVVVGAVQPPPPPPVVQVPVISAVTPDTASPTDGITNANVLTVAGTAAANVTVKVYDGANLVGSVVAAANGSWTLVTTALNDGNHSFTATASDGSGNTSAASGAKNVIIDTAAPVNPTIGLQSVDSGVAGDKITNVKVVSLTGVAEINSTIKVCDGATVLGSAVANAEGVWNLVLDVTDDQAAALAGAGIIDNLGVSGDAPNQTQGWAFTTAPLADGVHNFTVTSTDAAGNVSAVSALNVTIDTVAPNAPVITGNSVVNTNHVQLTGTAEAGSTVKLLDGSTVLGTATANASGAWSFATAALADGVHVLTATASDVAGNTSVASQAVNTAIAKVVESFGATSLTVLGNQYHFGDGSGSGPTLKFQGNAITVGQIAGWAPIAVEQTASGYLVAWKSGSAYTIWTTDSSGNYISNTAAVSGTDATVKSAESSFHQDLNGDGVIDGGVTTPPPPPPPPPQPNATVIESFGATSLTTVGDQYHFGDNSGSGPVLKFQAGAITVGQIAGWAPIAVEQTASGYLVAWKSGNTYTVWTTDSSGNYISNTAAVSGTDATLKSAESAFHQDLNGDGVIGNSVTTPPPPPPPPPSATVIESFGSTSLTVVSNQYHFGDNSGSGPTLKFQGGAITVGQIGTWSPIGVEKTTSGYQVAWKVTGADQYTIWTTDNDGNYITNTAVVAATSAALKSAEGTLHQDLNGDGVISGAGPAPVAIVSGTAGNDTLTSTGANEVLFGNGGNNAFVFAGNFGRGTVADFHADSDVLQFSNAAFTDVAEALAHPAQMGVDVAVTVDAAHSVTLSNAVLAQINAHNVHLV
jgi:serralysin